MTGVQTCALPISRKLVDIFDNEHANEVKMQALSLLHEEAMKSFSGGSRAAADFVEAYARRAGNAPAPDKG